MDCTKYFCIKGGGAGRGWRGKGCQMQNERRVGKKLPLVVITIIKAPNPDKSIGSGDWLSHIHKTLEMVKNGQKVNNIDTEK